MFSIITNIYNMKTKGPILMKLFTTTANLRKISLDNLRCSMFAPRVIRHKSIQYSCFCHTRINMDASIFFTAAKIRTFRSERSRGNRGTKTRSFTLHEMHVAQ